MTTKNRIGWLRASRSIAGLVIAAGLLSAATNATTLSLDPASQNVGVGDSFDLALNISGLGDPGAPSLSAFDLDVVFDAARVQFDSFVFENSLGNLVASDAVLMGSGLVNLFAVSDEDPLVLDGSQPGAFTLGTLHFTALTPGNGTFSLTPNNFGDAVGNSLTLDSVEGAAVTITGTQPVPDGGPGMMAALGIGALMLAHEKMRRRAVPI
jgi:hypothetical protein